MKPRILVLALISVLGTGCSLMDTPRSDLLVQPVMSVRHSAAYARSYYQLARYYHGQNRLAQAEDAYLKAVAIDSHYVDAYNALASLYAERGDLERSAKMFEKVTAMAPSVAYLHNNLGYAYYLQGRLDEAYIAVRKAVIIDKTLARGWANLERIASLRSEALPMEVVKSRRLDALPVMLAVQPIPGRSINEPAAVIAGVAPISNAAPASEASTASTASMSPEKAEPPKVALTDVAFPDTSPRVAEKDSVALARIDESMSLPEPRVENRIPDEGSGQSHESPPPSQPPIANVAVATSLDGGSVDAKGIDAVLDEGSTPVSSTQAVVPEGVRAQSDDPVGQNESSVDISTVRLEVSNGNGVTRFANKFSAHLKNNKMPVRRITNYGSFSLKETVIEYQPGYEAAAQALMRRASLSARLVPAIRPRQNSDIRIVLGRDALKMA